MVHQINLEPDEVYTLEVKITGKEVAAIMAALGKMPHDEVCSPIMQIKNQLIEITKIEVEQLKKE